MQHTRHVLEPCYRHVSGLTQVLFAQLLASSQVGIPVAVTTLRRLLACRVGASLSRKGKGRDPGQPGKPGGTLQLDVQRHVVMALKELVGLLRGGPGKRIGCNLRHDVTLVRWPNALCYITSCYRRDLYYLKYTLYVTPLQVRTILSGRYPISHYLYRRK